MAQENDEANHTTDWKTRLRAAQKENRDLYRFIKERKEAGTICQDGSKAFFQAAVQVMQRAGIVEPQLGDGPQLDDATLCVVLAQANHEGRQALIGVHPEIAEELARVVPSQSNGRGR